MSFILEKTVKFYTLLGFQFSPFKPDEQHIEPLTPNGSTRLMIDTKNIIKDIIGENPIPSNHSSFAIQYNSKEEVNQVTEKVAKAGFKIFKEPWDAFWDQRYAIIEYPDGYKIDSYAALS